jgi:RNA polymerase sigma-70 factor, ECF subfamily
MGVSLARGGDWDWVGIRRRCLREAMRVLKDRSEAEDVVQEALMRAWRKRATCRRQDDPVPWLLQITRNEALRRKGGARHPVDPLDTIPELATDDESIDVLPERISVQRALADLTVHERALLELRYGADMTQPAVASALDMPEGTAKVQLHRLRVRLREVLDA